MRKYFNILLNFLLLSSQIIYAQSNDLLKYLPLKVNNTWVYYGTGTGISGYGTWYDKYKLTADTLINGNTYFLVQHTRVNISIYGNPENTPIRLFRGNFPIRVDSSTLNIYKSSNCGTNNFLLVDSLKAKVGDTASTCDFHGDRVACNDTTIVKIFDANRRSKKYFMQAFEGGNYQTYVENIGVTYFYFNQLNTTCWYNLRGCIIDGVLYGDTTIVGINLISSGVPENYTLHQNYPNPFNPVTKIKFSVPQTGKGQRVKVVIFNILGEEVAKLVNQEFQPGTYEVEWIASNYPSGIYYYKLEAGGYSETKKMVLLK